MILNRRYRGKIEKIPLPMQNGTLTYNGNAQSPVWLNYDSTKMTMGGVTSSVNVGTFTATFTPKRGYCWQDGGRDAKNVTWKMKKATPALSLGKTECHICKNYPNEDSTAVFCISDGTYVIQLVNVTGAEIKKVEQIANGIKIIANDGYHLDAEVSISVSGGTLSVVSGTGNTIMNITCTVYVGATVNCNQSNICQFVIYRHGVASGS